ncbi:S1C family serine protease [Thermodesulfobacteriota bacterium]
MNKTYVLLLSVCLLILFNGPGLPVIPDLLSEAEAISLKNVFQQVNPAVVVVYTHEDSNFRVTPNTPIIKGNIGSGIVISKDGLVMTAAHVVQFADEVSVHFLDETQVMAKVVSSAQQADVALLKLNEVPDNLHVAKFGNSDSVSIGDELFVVGAPYGLGHTLTVGHLSGRKMSIGVCNQLTPIEFLQTDAAINLGNSGGPMFNMNGELIGIVSHILSRSGGSEGLGFATSINTAKELLMNQESFWIGLEAYLVTDELAKALNVPQKAGLLIQRVANDSPGYKLGLRPGRIPVQIGREKFFIGGDIILEVQGMPISTNVEETCEIRDTMGRIKHGKRVDFKVLRGGEIINLYISK